MRLYTFTNSYLSPIQCGIQTAHIVSELSVTFKNTYYYDEWSRNHKTIIVCNGGNQAALENLAHELSLLTIELYNHEFYTYAELSNQIPVSKFYEDSKSLGGALTAVGIILPEDIYNPSHLSPHNEHKLKITDLIKSYKLAG